MQPQTCSLVLAAHGPDDQLDTLVAAMESIGGTAENEGIFPLQQHILPPPPDLDAVSTEVWLRTHSGSGSLQIEEGPHCNNGQAVWHLATPAFDGWQPPESPLATLAQRWPDLQFIMTYVDPVAQEAGVTVALDNQFERIVADQDFKSMYGGPVGDGTNEYDWGSMLDRLYDLGEQRTASLVADSDGPQP